jgi:hypothetical protein
VAASETQARTPGRGRPGRHRAAAEGRNLRDVAADFGVSHETVRSIVGPPSPVGRAV